MRIALWDIARDRRALLQPLLLVSDVFVEIPAEPPAPVDVDVLIASRFTEKDAGRARFRLLQLPGARVLAGARVDLREALNGRGGFVRGDDGLRRHKVTLEDRQDFVEVLAQRGDAREPEVFPLADGDVRLLCGAKIGGVGEGAASCVVRLPECGVCGARARFRGPCQQAGGRDGGQTGEHQR